MMRKPIRLIVVTLLIQALSISISAQILTPVVDDEHNGTTAVETIVKTFSTVIKGKMLPFLEKVSKVQDFLKKAVNIVSAVIRNTKMTKDLIQEEIAINEMFVNSIQQINEAEDLPEKWKHLEIILSLFRESVTVFEVFDLATQENRGIIDDKGRIELIKVSLKKVRAIKKSMKLSLRRANRCIYQFRRKKKELELFTSLYGQN